METLFRTAEAFFPFLNVVLSFINPLSLEGAIPADMFMGYVGFSIAICMGGFLFPVFKQMGKDRGKAIALAVLLGVVSAASMFHTGEDPQRITEVVCFTLGGIIRFAEGMAAVACISALVSKKTLRGHSIQREDLVHPVVFIFTGLQALFYFEKVDFPSAPLGIQIWLVLSILISLLSFAGIYAFTKWIIKVLPTKPSVSAVSTGFCTLVLLTSLHAPLTPGPKAFFLAAFPIGVALATVVRFAARILFPYGKRRERGLK